MYDDVERSYDIAEESLRALKALRLAAHPRNIELLYTHISRSNPALSKDLLGSVAPDGTMPQEQANRLYDLHILRTDLSGEIAEMIERFETEVTKVAGAVEKSGEDTRGYSKELTDLSGELSETGESSPRVAALMANILTVVKSARETNSALEEQLADSSEEINFLKDNIAAIQLEAMTDPLTGVKNRKAFDEAIEKLFANPEGDDRPLSLVFADVDYFKRFNDRWGHQTGDQVLRLVAEMMKANVKGQDVLARYGGEEFAILLPNTTRDNGVRLADTIRDAVGSRNLKKRRTNEHMGSVTLSMGVALRQPDDTVESLIERADQCLYAAKNAGRNRVVSDTDSLGGREADGDAEDAVA